MTKTPLQLMAVFLLIGLLVSVSVPAMDTIPGAAGDNPLRLQDTGLALVYAQSGADLSAYKKIRLKDATVEFKNNWRRDQNRSGQLYRSSRVSPRDEERIKADMADLLMEAFTAEIVDNGYILTEEAGDHVLIVQPAIFELDVKAPDTDAVTPVTHFAESAGEMSLYLELYDPVSGAIIATAMDSKEDWEVPGSFRRQNRVTNRVAAKRMLRSWAKTFRETLDAGGVAGNHFSAKGN